MHFVTVTSESYALGTAVLMASVRDAGRLPEARWSLLSLEELSEQARRTIDATGVRHELVGVDELGRFRFNERLLGVPRRRVNFAKLSAFLLPAAETLCFLDSDMLCVGDISEAAAFEPFTAVQQMGHMGPLPFNNRPMFNSGFFVFRPDRGLFDELQEWADREIRSPIPLADQWILNHYFHHRRPHDVHFADLRWNVLMALEERHPRLWRMVSPDVRLFHFTSSKPWRTRLEGEFAAQWYRYAEQLA